MATAVVPRTKLTGGSFLIEEHPIDQVFTVEDLSDEHQQIAQTTIEFARNEIVPNSEKIEHEGFAVTRALIRKACEIGIANVDIPEQYGGSDMDKISSAIIAEHLSVSGSFSVAFGGHTGIGTLPIVYFGTPEQKAKYLPKLATGELIAAYALSESTSASDAMNARTKAVLSPDGKEWVLNGEKMWITNGGFDDVNIGKAAVGDPHLLAVEVPLFAIRREHGLGAGIHGVRGRGGFRERIGGDPFASGQLRQVFGLLLRGAEIHDRQGADAGVSAKGHAEAAGDGEMLGDDGRGNLVHIGAAVLLRDVNVGDADLAGLADQRARDRKFLVLDLLDVGKDFVLRELVCSLRNLPVLVRQVLRREDLVNLVFFNEETSACELCFRKD